MNAAAERLTGPPDHPSLPPPRGKWARRLLTVGGMTVGGGALGYGLSWIISGCATCAVGTSPMGFGLLLGLVAGWSAYSATS